MSATTTDGKTRRDAAALRPLNFAAETNDLRVRPQRDLACLNGSVPLDLGRGGQVEARLRERDSTKRALLDGRLDGRDEAVEALA